MIRVHGKTLSVSCPSAMTPILLWLRHTLRLGNGMSVIITAIAPVDGAVQVGQTSTEALKRMAPAPQSNLSLYLGWSDLLCGASLAKVSHQACTLQNLTSL